MNNRIHSFTLDSDGNATFEFGLRGGMLVTIDVSIAADGSPTGTQTIEKYELDGWATFDTDTEAFTDPAAGAAVSKLRLENMESGRYRYVYTSGSGGAAGGIRGTVRVDET